jgi:hypothetical protein
MVFADVAVKTENLVPISGEPVASKVPVDLVDRRYAFAFRIAIISDMINREKARLSFPTAHTLSSVGIKNFLLELTSPILKALIGRSLASLYALSGFGEFSVAMKIGIMCTATGETCLLRFIIAGAAATYTHSLFTALVTLRLVAFCILYRTLRTAGGFWFRGALSAIATQPLSQAFMMLMLRHVPPLQSHS